jgi:hypothetical protein
MTSDTSYISEIKANPLGFRKAHQDARESQETIILTTTNLKILANVINFHLAPMTHYPKVNFLSERAAVIRLNLQSLDYQLSATSLFL